MSYAEGRRYCDADSHLMELHDWLPRYADPAIRERIRPFDLLGFAQQLVFSTFAPTQFLGDDLELLYGGTRAHNRAIADFCSDDERMIAVAFVPWADPERTRREAEEAIRMGGGENICAKDYMSLHTPPEIFLSCMVLDGVFDAFPRLRGGCIEQGAMWVVPWLARLDQAQQMFQKTEPALRALSQRPSELVRGHLWFTPFPTEPVGWVIENAGADLFLFSSDYPHPEGGRDPLGRFEASLASISDDAKDRFYAQNFGAMTGC